MINFPQEDPFPMNDEEKSWKLRCKDTDFPEYVDTNGSTRRMSSFQAYSSAFFYYGIDGERHRLSGPALQIYDEQRNPRIEWWIEGKRIDCQTQEEFERIVALLEFA